MLLQLCKELTLTLLTPSVPAAHYSDHKAKLFLLQTVALGLLVQARGTKLEGV